MKKYTEQDIVEAYIDGCLQNCEEIIKYVTNKADRNPINGILDKAKNYVKKKK